MNFGEEVVRGQPVFVLSGLLQDLERHLREAAGAGPWQVRAGAAVQLNFVKHEACVCAEWAGAGLGEAPAGGSRRWALAGKG
jgi:hypothetical protein